MRSSSFKRVLSAAVAAVLCVTSVFGVSAAAHSGRTDKYGGHTDRSTGIYHYHNGGSSSSSGTSTNTSTNTSTKSSTSTSTKSSTNTSTKSSTNTSTKSSTNTSTKSSTNTSTKSSTNTSTKSNTSTSTKSSTNTSTKSTASNTAKKSVWQDVKELSGAKYYSDYITWVEKYSKKDGKNIVTYSKSRTKKLVDKLKKAAEKDEPQFSYSMINKEGMLSVAVKGSKFKAEAYVGKEGMAYCGNSKELTFLDVNGKKKCSISVKDAEEMGLDVTDFAQSAAEVVDWISDDISGNGEVFKFTSGGKTYYYEKFDDDLGFLFSESGKVLAGNIDGDIFCMSVSYTVKDSVFNIPAGYKNVKLEDIDWL